MSDHKKMFTKYMFTFAALLLLCVCYSINLSVIAPSINSSTHYKTFINKVIKQGELNTYIDKNMSNEQSINELTMELLDIGKFQNKNPLLDQKWSNSYRLALVKSLYDLNQDKHKFINQDDLTKMSMNANILSVKSFVKLNEQSFIILITMFSTLSFCFVYLVNYHVLHRYSKYDNRLPYPVFSVDYFILHNNTIEQYKNGFKIEVIAWSFIVTVLLNVGAYPLFLVF